MKPIYEITNDISNSLNTLKYLISILIERRKLNQILIVEIYLEEQQDAEPKNLKICLKNRR